MDFLERMNKTINYIEDHLVGELSHEEIAKISCCPLHQFNRIFSYVVGEPISIYIRRRRLTLAAFELQSSNVKIIDIALKYGYDSHNSFTKAFIEMHDITPKEARSKGVVLKSYPRLSFYLTIKGDIEMNYRIEEKESITFVGARKRIINDDDGPIWSDYYKNGPNNKLRDELKVYRPPFFHLGIYIKNEDGSYDLFLGGESDGKAHEDLDTFTVPPRTWAVFTVNGVGGKAFGEAWARINSEWFPTSGYTQILEGAYELEIFPPGDAGSPDYKSEIWVPIVKK